MLPVVAGSIVDIAPVHTGGWLLLSDDGRIGHWTADTYEPLATTALRTEETGKRRLHANGDGTLAVVVNDYGRYGEVLDLRSGKVAAVLDNQGYHEEQVPFSVAFVRHRGREVLVHRTAWNRLDATADGVQLTDRGEVDLDYFHGALHPSPDGLRILDDGWVWHPVGIPAVFTVEQWLADEDDRVSLCQREYYWDHAMTWLDDEHIAIGGLGDDDTGMRPGARIFDLAGAELRSFPGPAGRFFSDGTRLFSADTDGLRIWDPADGTLLETVPDFNPTRHNRHTGEFVQVTGTMAKIWTARRSES